MFGTEKIMKAHHPVPGAAMSYSVRAVVARDGGPVGSIPPRRPQLLASDDPDGPVIRYAVGFLLAVIVIMTLGLAYVVAVA